MLVQAYSFTSDKIAKALLDAHKRGVKVEVIFGKSQRGDQYSSADFLANSGIPPKIDASMSTFLRTIKREQSPFWIGLCHKIPHKWKGLRKWSF